MTCRGHNYPVWDVAANPYGHYFASAGADKVARVWNVERSQPLRMLTGEKQVGVPKPVTNPKTLAAMPQLRIELAKPARSRPHKPFTFTFSSPQL